MSNLHSIPSNLLLSKIKLEKVQHDLDFENWMTGLSLVLSEETRNDQGEFEFAAEKTVKLRNFFCHQDLLEKFNLLRCHMALICEISPMANVGELELRTPEHTAPKIFVTGVTLTGSDENAGVVLTGFKVLANDKILNLNTPNINLGADDYAWSIELAELLDELENEAKKAYTHGKRKIIQGDLFDNPDADGGTDDESNDMGDPNSLKSVKKGIKALKNLGVELSMSADN